MTITNNSEISLALAVWLVNDDYDYINDENYVSVTRLMRPLRHIILPGRIPPEKRQTPDVTDFIARAYGNSVHNSIELAWVHNHRKNLAKLGHPQKLIDRVVINPDPSLVQPDQIPVYLEQRLIAEFEGWKIGGKFDMVAEGHVEDNKSTSVFNWINGTRDEENQLQGSLYRWVDSLEAKQKGRPLIITEDFMRVNYIFTDWQKFGAQSNPKYPDTRVKHKDIELLSLKQTEDWVRWKLDQIRKFYRSPESQIPECTDDELWRSKPQFKYFSDPSKAKDPGARSTKNFDTLAAANAHLAEKGGKGVVITKEGEVKRCGYCEAFDTCTQKDRYFS